MNYLLTTCRRRIKVKKHLIIKISPDGTINAETKGIKGKECAKYLSVLSEMLEADIVNSEYTPEYYENSHVSIETIKLAQKAR